VGVIELLSSFIASECSSNEKGLVVRNPGRALFSSVSERERLRALGSPFIQLPDLVAIITLISDRPGPFDYRLSSAFVCPDGEVGGPMETMTFRWQESQRVERISVKLGGHVRFFEQGGLFRVRFLLNGEPLCDIPLPIFWDEDQ
jgi:hypothetical protein